MKTKVSFDEKCYELAKYFMEDAPTGRWQEQDVSELAGHIQEAIEDFMHEEEDETFEDGPTEPDTLANLGMCEADFR